jgi:hypothetical protein
MGKTYIVGTRKPAKLGVHVPVPVAAPAPASGSGSVLYYVVNRNAALALQGYSAIKARTFTAYGIYSTLARAKAHIAQKRMGLYACVVPM